MFPIAWAFSIATSVLRSKTLRRSVSLRSPGGLALELFKSVPYGKRALLVAKQKNVQELFSKVGVGGEGVGLGLGFKGWFGFRERLSLGWLWVRVRFGFRDRLVWVCVCEESLSLLGDGVWVRFGWVGLLAMPGWLSLWRVWLVSAWMAGGFGFLSTKPPSNLPSNQFVLNITPFHFLFFGQCFFWLF